MSHSIEELRSAAMEALAGRVDTGYPLDQVGNLKIAVAEVLRQRDGAPQKRPTSYRGDSALDPADADAFLEVFWDLFRDGVVTLGADRHNENYPFFRLTRRGRQLAEGDDSYFLHDLSAFEDRVRLRVPAVNDVTLLYLKEALQAFRSGCVLASAVMLGVAAEHTFLLILDTIAANPAIASDYASVTDERTLARKINKFKNKILQSKASVPRTLLEDFETQFLALQSLIRTFRNESGHPTGQLMDREQAFVNIQVFIPFCRKAHELIDYFKSAQLHKD